MSIFRFESEASFAFIERIEHPSSPTPVHQLAVLQRFTPGADHRVRPLAPRTDAEIATWRRYKTRETRVQLLSARAPATACAVIQVRREPLEKWYLRC
jgi:hypothetical protein